MLVAELGLRLGAWNEPIFEKTASCSLILANLASLIHPGMRYAAPLALKPLERSRSLGH
jgi:hypothetical protein